MTKVHFVGAGPGHKELITLRGYNLLKEADVVIYAGSLVNPDLLEYCKEGCEIYNSAMMDLMEIIDCMEQSVKAGKEVVRLQTGDFSIYGSIREQIEEMKKRDIEFTCTPGVSSFLGAASQLGVEYTVPEVSQSVIITRMEGRTPVPTESRCVSPRTVLRWLSSCRCKRSRTWRQSWWQADIRRIRRRPSSTKRPGRMKSK